MIWGLEGSSEEFGGLNSAMNSVLVTVLTCDLGFFDGEADALSASCTSDRAAEPVAPLEVGLSIVVELDARGAVDDRGFAGKDSLLSFLEPLSHFRSPVFPSTLRFFRGGSERSDVAAASTSPWDFTRASKRTGCSNSSG